MQLRYGSYSFDVSSVWAPYDLVVETNAAGQPIKQRLTMHVHGFLLGADQAGVDNMEAALRLALRIPFQDLVLYRDDLVTPSTTRLTQSDSITGVVISNIRFPSKNGVEYVNEREFMFDASADYALPGTADMLVSFYESVVIQGTGRPRRVVLESISDAPQVQVPVLATKVRIIQRGESVGFMSRPDPMPMLAPALCIGGLEGEMVEPKTPERRGSNYINWGIAWTYIMESAGPLFLVPNLWR